MFEKNSSIIAPNVLDVKKNEYNFPAHISKDKSNSEKLVITLIIPNGEGWHYFAKKVFWILKRAHNEVN